jgi:hypothetical protein
MGSEFGLRLFGKQSVRNPYIIYPFVVGLWTGYYVDVRHARAELFGFPYLETKRLTLTTEESKRLSLSIFLQYFRQQCRCCEIDKATRHSAVMYNNRSPSRDPEKDKDTVVPKKASQTAPASTVPLQVREAYSVRHPYA